jgi:DNA-binding response OmpR family regulator
MMPEMKCIPFIFVSAKSEKTDMRKGMDLGADDYLIKPFSSDELLSVISARTKKAFLMKEVRKSNVKSFEAFIKNPSAEALKDVFSESMRMKKVKRKEMLFIEGDTLRTCTM